MVSTRFEFWSRPLGMVSLKLGVFRCSYMASFALSMFYFCAFISCSCMIMRSMVVILADIMVFSVYSDAICSDILAWVDWSFSI